MPHQYDIVIDDGVKISFPNGSWENVSQNGKHQLLKFVFLESLRDTSWVYKLYDILVQNTNLDEIKNTLLSCMDRHLHANSIVIDILPAFKTNLPFQLDFAKYIFDYFKEPKLHLRGKQQQMLETLQKKKDIEAVLTEDFSQQLFHRRNSQKHIKEILANHEIRKYIYKLWQGMLGLTDTQRVTFAKKAIWMLIMRTALVVPDKLLPAVFLNDEFYQQLTKSLYLSVINFDESFVKEMLGYRLILKAAIMQIKPQEKQSLTPLVESWHFQRQLEVATYFNMSVHYSDEQGYTTTFTPESKLHIEALQTGWQDFYVLANEIQQEMENQQAIANNSSHINKIYLAIIIAAFSIIKKADLNMVEGLLVLFFAAMIIFLIANWVNKTNTLGHINDIEELKKFKGWLDEHYNHSIVVVEKQKQSDNNYFITTQLTTNRPIPDYIQPMARLITRVIKKEKPKKQQNNPPICIHSSPISSEEAKIEKNKRALARKINCNLKDIRVLPGTKCLIIANEEYLKKLVPKEHEKLVDIALTGRMAAAKGQQGLKSLKNQYYETKWPGQKARLLAPVTKIALDEQQTISVINFNHASYLPNGLHEGNAMNNSMLTSICSSKHIQ